MFWKRQCSQESLLLVTSKIFVLEVAASPRFDHYYLLPPEVLESHSQLAYLDQLSSLLAGLWLEQLGLALTRLQALFQSRRYQSHWVAWAAWKTKWVCLPFFVAFLLSVNARGATQLSHLQSQSRRASISANYSGGEENQRASLSIKRQTSMRWIFGQTLKEWLTYSCDG